LEDIYLSRGKSPAGHVAKNKLSAILTYEIRLNDETGILLEEQDGPLGLR
jgi:hypothetical protein